MAEKETEEEYIPSFEEMQLVFKMVSTDYGLWKEYWGDGEHYNLKLYYSDYPERHPIGKYVFQFCDDLKAMSKKYTLEDLLDRLGYFDDYHFKESLGWDYFHTYDDDMLDDSDDDDDTPFTTSLQELTGIDKAYLPPREKLIPEHVIELSQTFELFLMYLNIDIEAPNYGEYLRYLLIRDYWDKPLPFNEDHNIFTWKDEMGNDLEEWWNS